MSAKSTVLIVETFKEFYRDLNGTRLDSLPNVYDSKILFKDPVHEVRGINALHSYMSDMYKNVTRCRFEYLDQVVSDNRAYIKWNMYFSHKSLGGKQISVRGISQIEFGDRIYYHEDVYDMGELLYEHLPIMGQVTRWLKNRMAKAVN
ncbi:nuclear transport factor 2 family protein [Teredinibacter turnerae]|uniref:nuclear transport factor 2 family protein n=1 Tax=Teredinibacter turnerae TaxID=2426 RepID=UPI00036560AA|nr:nuclear transport factor 2 family protein [Teredinibacter turnerae]